MSKQLKYGGPAFPRAPIGEDCERPYGHQDGMTLRDWFAGQALNSVGAVDPRLPGDPLPQDYVWPTPTPEKLAERRATWAYMQADAMLAARGEA